tara:strand:- start:93 stop:314 length:222 start_codon:yes stop_codon:yes gene_type:complete
MSITKVTGEVIDENTNLTVGIITAAAILKSDGSGFGNTILTIGVRVGAAVTFRASGVSFDVLTRDSGNVPISL